MVGSVPVWQILPLLRFGSMEDEGIVFNYAGRKNADRRDAVIRRYAGQDYTVRYSVAGIRERRSSREF